MERLTSPDEIEGARLRISALLDGRGEWFCAEGRGGATSELRRGEWDVSAERGALLLSYWGARGRRVWRVRAWERRGEKIVFDATRRAGGESALLEFVPRASALAAVGSLAAARRAECERLASLVCASLAGARLEAARLSAGARRGEPGRYARITLHVGRGRVAATGPVVALGVEGADAFVSSALLWFLSLSGKRGREAPRRLGLFGTKRLAEAAAERVALLRAPLREVIEVYELDEEGRALNPLAVPALGELLDASPRLVRAARNDLSETARAITELAPGAIDCVRARHGETVRFHGLAFARVRRVAGRELAWFGTGGAGRARVLDESTWPDLLNLLAQLAEHRRADASDRRHALYASAPEAWLESILRRDVSRLDPGLRLAPLHAQFRATRTAGAGARPVDLLALRRDGRLAVIELKISEDAALPLQGADYWRRIAAHQRAGNVARARLFGDAEISDDPPLVYLVAPLLSFHRAFQTLARAVRPDVEMYRFDINEDWRAGVRVVRRTEGSHY